MNGLLPYLNSPISIADMWLKNRMVMSPLLTLFCGEDRKPNDRVIGFYEERAKGGIGLIIMEALDIDDKQPNLLRSMTLANDKYIESHKALTDTIHQHGCKIIAQLSHSGPESVSPLYGGEQPVGPSVCTTPVWGWPCRELQIDELAGIARQYGEAARRARSAGYDGIELDAAHGNKLLGSFLSPFRNRRTDEYSAIKQQSRTRFIKEILTEIKSKAGNDFPITLALSGYERHPSGRSICDTQRIAPELVRAGVDCFRISGGVADALVTSIVNKVADGDGINVSQAEAIKQVVRVPVIVVGRIHKPELAEKILANGQADLIGIGRPLLADSHWALKVKQDRHKDIRPCISCHYCFDSMLRHDNLTCQINPLVGRERELSFKSAKSQNIIVIGSGAAGLEAARLAAEAGHRVVIVERLNRLGGALVLASILNSNTQTYLRWLITQIKNLPIEIHTRFNVTIDWIVANNPDVVIVATGAQFSDPQIKGIEQPHVITGTLMRQIAAGAVDGNRFTALSGWKRKLINMYIPKLQPIMGIGLIQGGSRYWMPLGKTVVVIGASLYGVQIAQFIAERNRKVHLLETGTKIAPEIGKTRRNELMQQLDQLSITVNTEIVIEEIKKNSVVITREDNQFSIKCDSVVVTTQSGISTDFSQRIAEAGFTVYTIGDGAGPGLIANATRTAAETISQL